MLRMVLLLLTVSNFVVYQKLRASGERARSSNSCGAEGSMIIDDSMMRMIDDSNIVLLIKKLIASTIAY